MSATQMHGRYVPNPAREARAGNLALTLLRFTLFGVVLALVGTLGNVALKVLQG